MRTQPTARKLYLEFLYSLLILKFSFGQDHLGNIILPIPNQVLLSTKGDTSITIRLRGAVVSSPDQQICVWMKLQRDPNLQTPPTCSNFSSPYFNAAGIPVGIHELFAARASQGTIVELQSSQFEVQKVEATEFLPSYEWQLIPPDISVPAGLDIQLPLDGIHSKVARIPPDWRLQSYIEHGPKRGFFPSKRQCE